MRFSCSSIAVGTLLVVSAQSLATAYAAESAAKPPEIVTLGSDVRTVPARPGRPVTWLKPLAPAALQSAPTPSLPASGWKLAPFATSLPPGHATLSAEQRAKQAEIAGVTTPATPDVATKPPERSTIVLAAPGAPVVTAAKKPSVPVAGVSARSMTAALGPIPRDSWRALAASKPQSISTIERAPSGAPMSTVPVVDVQKGGAPRNAAAAKAPEITTTAPRDPALPPASPDKTTGKEVRP